MPWPSSPDGQPPLVSVITPSYNYARYLEACMRSVQQQGDDVQHVIVDDGSADDSWEVIRRLHPNPDADCVRQDNQGLSATLNRALGMATGKWVLWLNADDFLLPRTFEIFALAERRHPDASLVFGDTLFVNDDSRVVRLVAQPRFDRSLFEGGYNAFHVPSVFWRREAHPGTHLDETMLLLMDLDLWLSLTPPGTVVIKADAPFAAFRRHAEQISHIDRPTDAAEMRAIARRYDLHELVNASTGHPTNRAKRKHALQKLRDGAWGREIATRRYTGQQVDWTSGRGHPLLDLEPTKVRLRRSVSDRGGR